MNIDIQVGCKRDLVDSTDEHLAADAEHESAWWDGATGSDIDIVVKAGVPGQVQVLHGTDTSGTVRRTETWDIPGTGASVPIRTLVRLKTFRYRYVNGAEIQLPDSFASEVWLIAQL